MSEKTTEFGLVMEASPGYTARLAQDIEAMGFDYLLCPDTQNLAPDPYSQLTLASANTKNLRLGTGVTNPVTRDAAVTATALMSLQQESAGRAVCVIGRGDSSAAHIGIKNATTRQLRTYVEQIRAYMAGEQMDAADRHVAGAADPDNLEAIRDFAVAYLRREQDLDLKAFAVHFDVYFLESSLYDSGEVEATVERLVAQGHTYEQDGALWLKTTDFGDDKDRVMRKQDGHYTYFLPDVAYHHNKWQRGFERVINEQGADHHSTVTRVRAGLQALDTGIPGG